MNFIPHSRPFVGQDEITAVSRVIVSRQLAEGHQTASLEKEIAARAGHRYGVAVSSGTAALYCTLKALGIGPGCDVVIPSYVCTALLNAVLFANSRPVLSDVDPETGMMTSASIKKVLTKKTRAVIVPHLFGFPAPIREIIKLGIPVIEDCAQCAGISIEGAPIGSFGVATVFSFYATKLIAAGEGGAVATSDRKIADAIYDIKEYDKQEKHAARFNFKLSDVHAAIARVQIKKLDAMIHARRNIAKIFDRAFADLAPALIIPKSSSVPSAYFRYVLRVPSSKANLEKYLTRSGVGCGSPVYRPLHNYLRKSGFPGTEEFHRSALSIPVYPGLPVRDINKIIFHIKKWIKDSTVR
jgi:perosamine synthetase